MAKPTRDGNTALSDLLANAESWDATQTDFVLILLCTAGILIVCALVGLMILLGKRWGHPQAAQLGVASMFWGLAAVATIVYATVQQLMWAKANFLELLSGYGDPQEVSPPLPWVLWGALSVIYLLLIGWLIWNRIKSENVG